MGLKLLTKGTRKQQAMPRLWARQEVAVRTGHGRVLATIQVAVLAVGFGGSC